MLAVLTVSDVWEDNGTWHLGGAIEGVALPPHPDFSGLRATPAELRALFARRGWRRVVAWQARQPMHRAQFEFCLKSAIENEANLLLHPQAGGDITDAPAISAWCAASSPFANVFRSHPPSCRCCRRRRAKRARRHCCCAPSSRAITGAAC